MGSAHRATHVLVAVATLLGVAACGDQAPGPAQTTPAVPPSPTATTSGLPVPTTSRPTAPSTEITTPPPARDRAPLPDNPEAYAKAFVDAWVKRDRPRADDLGTKAAAHAVFSARAPESPVFLGCEGAAGSTYCRWEGVEYTLVVRVQNEKASLAQPQAVVEARFAH